MYRNAQKTVFRNSIGDCTSKLHGITQKKDKIQKIVKLNVFFRKYPSALKDAFRCVTSPEEAERRLRERTFAEEDFSHNTIGLGGEDQSLSFT